MSATRTSNASSIRRQFNAEVTGFMISGRRGQFKVQNLSFSPSLLHSFTPSLLHSFTPSLLHPSPFTLHSFTPLTCRAHTRNVALFDTLTGAHRYFTR